MAAPRPVAVRACQSRQAAAQGLKSPARARPLTTVARPAAVHSSRHAQRIHDVLQMVGGRRLHVRCRHQMVGFNLMMPSRCKEHCKQLLCAFVQCGTLPTRNTSWWETTSGRIPRTRQRPRHHLHSVAIAVCQWARCQHPRVVCPQVHAAGTD